MSNSIWHKRDETPKDFCDVVLANFATGSYCVFLSPFHNVSFDYDRWAYLTDIIAQADKAEQLQKEITQELDIYYSHNPGLHPADDCIYAIEKIIGYKRPKENQ